MIRNSSNILFRFFKANKSFYSKCFTSSTVHQKKNITQLQFTQHYQFATLPIHQVLTMPALSPTMKTGKILKWNKKVGDKVQAGDALCEVQTDKATVSFDVSDNGYIAKILIDGEKEVPVGEPVAIIVTKLENVKEFQNYTGKQQPPAQIPKRQVANQTKQQSKPEVIQSNVPSYPPHQKLTMPALSPTMKSGKIIKWNKKEGDAYGQGESLCQVETDKATVGYQTVEKGILAKILVGVNSQLPVGALFAISVNKKQYVQKFANYTLEDAAAKAPVASSIKKAQTTQQTPKVLSQTSQRKQGRIFVSPIAKTIANQKGINLNDIKGSGPNGRILKQDVQGYVPVQKSVDVQKSVAVQQPVIKKPQVVVQEPKAPVKKPAQKSVAPENPFQQIQLTSMRKTIAARLTESKSTIPHYYISADITMDETLKIRQEINKSQKQNGAKISVNDIIIKACALALRDYPQVNSQWNINTIKRFRYADISMAVSTDTGLLTPIIFRADTKGLLQIAKNTKDLAKRARQGKLQPHEFIGGTCSVSNLGMFGINQMLAVINPPQSMIVGVGKTQKKIVFDELSTDANKPYKVSNVMNVTISADHRVVDGALASLWITRFKRYLENPYNLIL